MTSEEGRRAAERVARASYGRLLALLVAHSRDIAAAEDALGDAFAAALSTWPTRGVPDNPEAWLFTAARNKNKNLFRHLQVRADNERELGRVYDARAESAAAEPFAGVIPDERLRLLFVCAHPSIDEAVRTPLMLQTVLGLDAQRIASAFLVAPKTMGQRLVRAKNKIRDAGLRMSIPEREELAARLDDVLAAVYVAYGTGWDDLAGADAGTRGLTQEAVFLARLLVTLLPHEPEPQGLLALMLYCEARRGARRDDDGRFVPLARQDPARWSSAMIVEAEQFLTRASGAGRFGRFQCEAAIQSVHVQRALTGLAQHDALRTLYDLLLAHAPSLGAAIGRAAVIIDAGDAAAGLAALLLLPLEQVAAHQPYWVTRARAHEQLGDAAAARAARETAIGLTEDPAVRAFLRAGG